MNSIGIEEGATFREPMPKCQCRWVVLMSYPPQTRLEKKCDWCKEQEQELANANQKEK